MTNTTKKFKRQLPRNAFLQVLAFVTQVGIGLWLVPYLVHSLGKAAYGLIPIAGMLTAYASLISQNIAAAVNRFLSIAIQKDDASEANHIFSTAFFTYLVLSILQVPVFAILLYYADNLITIPSDLKQDAIILLSTSALAFMINLVGSVFGVPMYARNRLDISRTIDIGRYILRTIGIVTLFFYLGPALRYVGYVDLAVSIAVLTAQILASKRLAPELSLRLRYYDWTKVRPIMGMGGWLLLNQVGTLLFLRMDVWVCNRFISADAGGEYAALAQWPMLIRQGATILSATVAPMVTIYYAQKNMDALLRLCRVSVQLLSIFLAIPIGMMCVVSPALLRLWIGESFAHLAPLMIIMLVHLSVNVGIMPLFNVQVALNRVRIPALLSVTTGAINVILAIILVRYFDGGMYSIALTGAILLTIKSGLFTPIYVAAILKEPWYTFLKTSRAALMVLAGVLAIGYALTRFFSQETWLELLLFSVVLGVFGMVLAWIVLPKSELRLIAALVPGRFRGLATRWLGE